MSSFAPAESGGPKVLSHAAAYESKIQEKDLKQAVIRGSKGAAAREPSSPTKNFVIAKKRHESWLKDRPAVWFGALALAVALLELSTAFRLVSAPDATRTAPPWSRSRCESSLVVAVAVAHGCHCYECVVTVLQAAPHGSGAASSLQQPPAGVYM